MKTFIYDREENGVFLPNGYHLDYEYVQDPTKYKDKYGFEKTVHFLGATDSIKVEKKLSSEVEEDFIYPVDQFGAIEKLIGEDETYSEFCFLNHIKKDTLKKLQNRKGHIYVFALEESRLHTQTLIFLHKKLNEFGILPSQLIYLTGNNWSANEEYVAACDKWFEQERLTIINTNSQMYLNAHDLLKGQRNNNVVRSREFYEEKKRKHQFLCFNRRIRPPRYCMIAMLYDNNLLTNNLVSFSIEDKHDLNCLGRGGKPDLDTMRKILGKTDINSRYISYYDELKKLSPMTVDYSNLLEVMGPGCENKQPYLDTYFSIVTETSFNEDTWCLTEKIWRPIIHYHPFIIQGSPYTIKQLKDLGFKSFSPYINESYDEETNVKKRMEKLTEEIVRICSMSREEMHEWYYGMKDILIYNRAHLQGYGNQFFTYLNESINAIQH